MSWIWKTLYLVLTISAVILFDGPICLANNLADQSVNEPSIEELTEQQELEKLISAAGDPAMLDQLALDRNYFKSLTTLLNKKLDIHGYPPIHDYLIKVYKRLPAPHSSECYASMGCMTAVQQLENIIANDFDLSLALYISFSTDNDSSTESAKAKAEYLKEVSKSISAKVQKESLAIDKKIFKIQSPSKKIGTKTEIISEIKAEALDLNCDTEKIFSDAARFVYENSNHRFSQKNLCGQDVIIKIVDQSTTNTKLFLTTIEISKCQTEILFRTQLQSGDVKVVQSVLQKLSDAMYATILKIGRSGTINTYHPSIDSCRINIDHEEHY